MKEFFRTSGMNFREGDLANLFLESFPEGKQKIHFEDFKTFMH